MSATERNQTQLSAKQLRCVDLLAEGRSDREAAVEVGCDRVTIWRWRREPAFRAELNARREELWRATRDRVRALLPRALDVVDDALASGDRQVALQLVRLAGVSDVLGRVGPTDAAIIAEAEKRERLRRDREQAEAEVSAAEQEANLELRRLYADAVRRSAIGCSQPSRESATRRFLMPRRGCFRRGGACLLGEPERSSAAVVFEDTGSA